MEKTYKNRLDWAMEGRALLRFILAGCAYFRATSTETVVTSKGKKPKISDLYMVVKCDFGWKVYIHKPVTVIRNGKPKRLKFQIIGQIDPRTKAFGYYPLASLELIEYLQRFSFVFNNLKNGVDMSERVRFEHDGRCSGCRRYLKDPKTMAVGLGPTCRKKADKILAEFENKFGDIVPGQHLF